MGFWRDYPIPTRVMASRASPPLVSLWLLSLCSVAWAGLHRLSSFQLILPVAAPGLPKRLSVLRVNDLVLATYDSDSGRLEPRNGYSPRDRASWSKIRTWYRGWGSWAETEYQVLVEEINSSAPLAEPYYMQVLHTCEMNDATGDVRVIIRYALNGEDVLRYQSDQKRWFAVHPAARPVAERWNQKGASFDVMNVRTLRQCRTLISLTAPFTAQQTAQPTAHVALVPATQDQLRCLICHVTGFYPRPIEVTWERRSWVALGDQLTSRILPNGDPTFQIQVSIELRQEGPGPTEHVCVVRHSSLGNTPLRVTWHTQPTGQAVPMVIVGGCLLSALGVGTLRWYLMRKPGKRRHPAGYTHPCPEESRGGGTTETQQQSPAEKDPEAPEIFRKETDADPGPDNHHLSPAHWLWGSRRYEARPHSRPYMAYLEIQDGDKNYTSDGFLVAENFVLTAAHCQGDKITVVLGAHNICQKEASQQCIPVQRQISHPKYNRKTFKNDIMLLQLSERVKLNKWVHPIPLPHPYERIKPGTVASVASWGLCMRKGVFTNRLQEVDVVVLDDQTSLRNPDRSYHHYDPSTMLCAGNPGTGQDPVLCGFGGGPLVCGGRAHGIVSWGSEDGTYPTVYTRVTKFIPWIKKVLRSQSLLRNPSTEWSCTASDFG